MKRKKALITGVTGQDGSYLAELLLSQDYEVHAIVRRIALEDPQNRMTRILHLVDKIQLHAASMESYASIFKVVEAVQPDECYHLAAQSYVSYSFDDEFSTINTNITGTHYMISAIKERAPGCRFYFAGSSEMFGKVSENTQDENTKFHPRSPYGISKVAGFHLTQNYREAYGLFACSGILFNHESERRGMEFVTRKISNGVARIKYGMSHELKLGNSAALRDWGYAPEYVEAMHRMLQQAEPDDYVIATGHSHSVREFMEIAFSVAGLRWEEYVKTDDQLYRPAEVQLLRGDATKARQKLSWQPKTSFEELVNIMITADLRRLHA